jgi:hypothetical protein
MMLYEEGCQLMIEKSMKENDLCWQIRQTGIEAVS